MRSLGLQAQSTRPKKLWKVNLINQHKLRRSKITMKDLRTWFRSSLQTLNLSNQQRAKKSRICSTWKNWLSKTVFSVIISNNESSRTQLAKALPIYYLPIWWYRSISAPSLCFNKCQIKLKTRRLPDRSWNLLRALTETLRITCSQNTTPIKRAFSRRFEAKGN